MKRINFIFTISLLFFAWVCNAQITKSAADALVLNMLNNDTTIVVYSMSESISRNVSIYTADGVELTNPYDNSYVYFIDDMPSANWAHPCRYCFVNITNGAYTLVNQSFCPSNYDSFSRLGAIKNNNNRQWPYTQYTIPQKASPNGKLYAVLIGGDPISQDPIKIWYNISCVYTALVNKYGYKESAFFGGKSNLFVMAPNDVKNAVYIRYPDSTYVWDLNQSHNGLYEDDFLNNDIFTYSKDNIKNIFDNLSGENNTSDSIPILTEDDQLFVLLTGHGSYANTYGDSYFIINNNDDILYDYELANWVRNIKCSQMTFLIDCCYSGGFIDNLMNDTNSLCKNRAVYTATDDKHYSCVEMHITGINREDTQWQRVDEFVYYWSAALLGYYPILETHVDWLTGPWYQYDNTAIGEFPWNSIPSFNEGNGYSHIGYDINPDTNSDGIVSLDETFSFANNLDSFSHKGYFNPRIMVNEHGDSCVEYPQASYESTFTKELITLDGYKGTIDDTVATGANHTYVMDGNVTIVNNAMLSLSNGCGIIGNASNRTIYNHGSLNTALGVNNATFKNINIINGNHQNFTMSNCVFDTCGVITANDGPLAISNSVFNETHISATTFVLPSIPYTTNIIGNTFNNNSSSYSIYLNGLPGCYVGGNTINYGTNGIAVYQLLNSYKNYVFEDNAISNCSNVGFLAYNSCAKVYNNSILGNDGGGLHSLNLSSLYVTGHSIATSASYTQQFGNNGVSQVYASVNSYPIDFHYNCLQGRAAKRDTILLFESPQAGNPSLQFDVTKNNWSYLQDNAIPSHIYTGVNGTFVYLPTWNFASGPLPPLSSPQEMLNYGNDLLETGDYDGAKAIFTEIVSNYSSSPEALAALKALFSMEVDTNGNFIDLKNYYLDLTSDDNLGDLADNLANRCDVKIGNYADAIAWYEDKINDPNALYSERIFAEIDLGNLYIKIGNSGIRGSKAEYIPTSKEKHLKRTEYLLSLLPSKSENGINDNGVIKSVSTQLSCSPNPADNTMVLSYDFEGYTNVNIILYKVSGEVVKTINIGSQNSGTNNVEIDISDMPNGLYFCNIEDQGNILGIIKIIVKH